LPLRNPTEALVVIAEARARIAGKL